MARKPSLTWITEYWKEPLKLLLSLDLEHLQAMAESIRGAVDSTSKTLFVESVSARVDASNPERLKPVVRMLVDLEMTRAEDFIAPKMFAEAVVEVGRTDEDLRNELPNHSDSDWDKVVSVVSEFFSCPDTLGAVSKGSDIVFQNERIFYRARILTELRPVFGDSPETPPKAFVVQHTLRIHYSSQSETRSIYFALDSEDLKNLTETLDRAIKKDRTLRSHIQSNNMIIFD